MKENKLNQVKEILKELEQPKQQRNDRSAWVFLALANIKPTDNWSNSQAPLLQTYKIMEFIRDHYGKDYKPNSRETIRRQTLHQFEQSGIVERNKDNPSRPTNSKDNNYSLTQQILEILWEFPKGNWKEKIATYKRNLHSFQKTYHKRISKEKVPVTLPNGQEVKLSPGKHNQLHADIIHEFCPRFVGKGGIVLYLGDTASSRNEGGKFMVLESEQLELVGIPPMSHDKLPDIIIYNQIRNWLFLIEAVTSHGPISQKRWIELEKAFRTCKAGKVYVTAFPNAREFRRNAADIAWETEVWIADQPDHLIHFNGDKFLGPHK